MRPCENCGTPKPYSGRGRIGLCAGCRTDRTMAEYLRASARAVLGYTHAWRDLDPELWGWCMASVETSLAATHAQEQGWRTYRTRPTGSSSLAKGERGCPAAKESPTHGKVTCETCRLCDGWSRGRALPNIVIRAHGASARRVHEDG